MHDQPRQGDVRVIVWLQGYRHSVVTAGDATRHIGEQEEYTDGGKDSRTAIQSPALETVPVESRWSVNDAKRQFT